MKINPVNITKQAIEEIKSIREYKNIPDDFKLRIGIKGSVGCAGLNYIIGFDKANEFDLEYDIDGISLIIDKRQTMFLIGVKLDFYNGSDARGFKFTKPESLSKL